MTIQPEDIEPLARARVLIESALRDIDRALLRAVSREVPSHDVLTHDGSAREPGDALPACLDDDPPSRPV